MNTFQYATFNSFDSLINPYHENMSPNLFICHIAMYRVFHIIHSKTNHTIKRNLIYTQYYVGKPFGFYLSKIKSLFDTNILQVK